jgi:sugar-specific transcriptional regulator TrmB
MNLEKNLNELGLTSKEAKMYLTSIELGKANISDISKKSGLNRSTAYIVLGSLRDKGLMMTIIQKKKRLYVPADPSNLQDMIEKKNMILEQILPRLKGMSNLPSHKPTMSYYEGESGILKTYLDNLTAKGEILTIAGENTFNELIINKVPDYIERRAKNRILLKIISPDTEAMRKWKQQDVQHLRITKLVPRDRFPFKVNIDIYNDKVAITSMEQSIGLIIEDAGITETLRLFFKLSWELLD